MEPKRLARILIFATALIATFNGKKLVYIYLFFNVNINISCKPAVVAKWSKALSHIHVKRMP